MVLGVGLRVLVCGGRYFTDMPFLYQVMDDLHEQHSFSTVIHGCAKGADTAAGQWARDRGVPEERYPADWGADPRGAGPKRNTQMLDEGNPDLVVAFEGQNGTADMVWQAQRKRVRVYVVERDDQLVYRLQVQ